MTTTERPGADPERLRSRIGTESAAAGFARRAFWTDPHGLFGVTLARAD